MGSEKEGKKKRDGEWKGREDRDGEWKVREKEKGWGLEGREKV